MAIGIPNSGNAGNTYATKQVAVAVYDVAGTDSAGVANGLFTTPTHGSGVFIPANAVVTAAYFRVDTAFTSAASGTLAIQINAANDLVVGIIVTGAPYSSTGIKGTLAGATNYTATIGNFDTPIEYTALWAASCLLVGTTAKEIKFVVGTGLLDTGKLTLFVEYVVG